MKDRNMGRKISRLELSSRRELRRLLEKRHELCEKRDQRRNGRENCPRLEKHIDSLESKIVRLHQFVMSLNKAA